MAARGRRAVSEYTADAIAHADNVTQLMGSSAKRLRVGDCRVIFGESETALTVIRVGPRGEAYD